MCLWTATAAEYFIVLKIHQAVLNILNLTIQQT
jgi:hypothetical protein